MSFGERRRRNGPIFKTNQKAHEEVLANEFWFSDGVPIIGKQFTATMDDEFGAQSYDISSFQERTTHDK
jgi:hypothetical protein